MAANKDYKQLKDKILSLTADSDFNETALEVFCYQFENNKLYGEFCRYLGKTPRQVGRPEDIPFLPIEFFKTHKIISGEAKYRAVFKSSGTGGSRSSHYVVDLELYKEIFTKGFEKFFGHAGDYVILALLPSYLEQGDSSLVFMVDDLIKQTANRLSGFFLDESEKLRKTLRQSLANGERVILFGVTYALLDFVEKYGDDYGENLIIVETGGMKGRRREMVREELHTNLKRGFSVDKIYSEYGMTELMSQAYSKGGGVFRCSDTMRILIRDTNDPLSLVEEGKSGGINVIDLGNLNSCSFVATQDLGKMLPGGDFEILGRFDNSDIRGCNLLVQ